MRKYKGFYFVTKPWEHQLKALKYLYERDYGALFTDMGTGKTKVMIDLIQNKGFKRVLIVAPKKACDVWEYQIGIHGEKGKFVVNNLKNMSKTKKVKCLNKIPSIPRNGRCSHEYTLVFIINYESVWREGIENVFLRKKFGIDCIICDESHRIKSPRSACSRYITKLGKVVKNKYLVTGTPLAESPLDIFAQYRFLDPSIFGTTYGEFRELYENIDPILTARIGFPIKNKKNPYKNLDDLKEKMFSCAFYVKSSIVLPEQSDIEYPIIMPKKTQALYKEVVDEGIVELNDKVMEISNVLSLVLRLQQVTSGYASVVNDDNEKSIVNVDTSKREALKELIEDLPQGEPLVVFATYKKDLKNIKKVCKELKIGYSEVSGSKDTLNSWIKGETQVIGVQYNSGSESIDLTRARYCIYYSLTRRLSLYEQSRKRIHRPGQTRPVIYYHFISKMDKGATIDEKMYEALKLKKDIVDHIITTGWK